MKKILKKILRKVYFFNDYYKIKDTKVPIKIRQYIKYKIYNKNKRVYWPVHKNSVVTGNVTIGVNSSVGATPGCYIQGLGGISIGDYTIVAPNVGIISANHDINDYRKHNYKKVVIGDYCWVGMNSIILPGVRLGNHTIVGAGSVVTNSFADGYCIIAGNPAKVIKTIDKDKVIDYKDESEYYGYIRKERFLKYKKKYLNDEDRNE
ncbi:acyltransferase [Clostridium sp.]|uniref:acyltransferase n=1 Tax=Clostridium sp. TaxID=1506 RepID=UPI00290D9CEE|nr:acyltransferase [Clostridium sp.]MDU7215713.1 acyltransferase [Clostridium sp.]